MMDMKKTLLTALTSFLIVYGMAQPPTNGLIGYWSLNGVYTNTGSATATATGVNTSFTTGYNNAPNTAVQFQGNLNSYIDFIDNGNFDFSGANNFTVGLNFYFNGTTTSGLVDNCLNYGGWGIWLWSTVAGTWNLQFNYRNNSVGSAAATNFTTGVWHHVTAVRNSGTISLYIDGVFRLSATEGTQTPSYPINMQAGAMCYGSFSPPRYNPFGGKIDELRIYNRALSAAEIAGLAAGPLPVKLTSFTASMRDNAVSLRWQTQYEQNSSHYMVERSTDGVNFSDAGRVAAAGNSNNPLNYSFNDLLPASLQSQKTIFYRLRSVDIDGKFSLSQVVALNRDTRGVQLVLSPNPAKDILQVQIGNGITGETPVYIYDGSGRQVYNRIVNLQPGVNSIPVNVSMLAPGTYFVRVGHGRDGYSKQFLKTD